MDSSAAQRGTTGDSSDAELTVAKTAYLEARTLYDALYHVTLHQLADVVSQDGEASSDDQEFQAGKELWESVSKRVAISEAKQVHRHPLNGVPGKSPFGLDEKSIDDANAGFLVWMKELPPALISAVESHLQSTCEHLVAFAFPPKKDAPAPTSSAVISAKALELGALVRSRREKLAKEEERVWEAKRAYVDLRVRHAEHLSRILDLSGEILLQYKLGHLAARDAAYVEYYLAVLDGMRLKLRIMKLDTLRSVFTPERVAELSQSRAALLTSASRMDAHLRRVRAELARYESAGEEFAEMVATWEKLDEMVEAVKEDIERLQGGT
ncbi:hypothetical protein M427DRAFT_56998 [Gonapodya prolifera JEL478]|uniref:HAUS augmin-like complex subunit 4 n=1 Tax=Gonapodya prolifera (strain JEL478) TaxID=1344416 RepID=A0A139AEV6_GONPJ|nr:hypothetical protein M427DRAFT_56998 [Gonapodya prolifera JEL478]|eukprot:KXS15114.1 hypothetical protein M427DRAFT_56998 [Gonapodya prolifera JEL478]